MKDAKRKFVNKKEKERKKDNHEGITVEIAHREIEIDVTVAEVEIEIIINNLLRRTIKFFKPSHNESAI